MIIPMIVLAIFSFAGGLIDMPAISGIPSWLNNYLRPVFADSMELMQRTPQLTDQMPEIFLAGFSTLCVLGVAWISYSLFGRNQIVSQEQQASPSFLKRLVVNKFFVDELYDMIIVKPIKRLSDFLYNLVEIQFIDRIVNGAGNLVIRGGNIIRFLQTGHVSFYLFIMVAGIIAILLFNIVLG